MRSKLYQYESELRFVRLKMKKYLFKSPAQKPQPTKHPQKMRPLQAVGGAIGSPESNVAPEVFV